MVLVQNIVVFFNQIFLYFALQTVAITEKKQRCGPGKSLQTTKICFTYPDASWVCKEPRETLDCDE